MEHEIQELLKKVAIKQTSHAQNQFISNILLKKKKYERYRPMINLNQIDQFLQYHHFKMGESRSSKRTFQENKFYGKTGPPGRIFQHSTSQEQQEICHFPEFL